ncbi:50S ribosomal protein L11 methyltransferase [Thiohalobacter sp. IOR34]|uniref:50S ribosomal protein L11 methyltransferase n=1 Tax=Thiohalobacter sp. IOR34 TaxID=3057176 RepID=UPI0025B169D2|nr:50S ribosomal protein L11 methyltransferase [Thiohalobacter sp. IOR34]WJW75191.1 50S ribosomal protein L11 methyltransferase [Thiohalobacter sp. IOR34]
MPWIQLSLEAGDRDPDALSDLFAELGALSVTLEDAADQPLLEPAPGTTPLWSRTRVVALFPDSADTALLRGQLAERCGEALAARIEQTTLDDRDWVRAWMDGFEPMRFGRRLWVCPSNVEPPEPDAVNLLLDPGLAFGSGTHPTTALCLEWLDAHPPRGLAVLDYGCGSGILAIAALKLGAARAVGVDLDPQALIASRDNAARNGLEGHVDARLPAELPADEPFDLVLANILANPLIDLAAHLAGHLRPGGRLVLSGILAEQAAEVAEAYAPWFEMASPVAQDGWVRLEGRRR